MKKISRNQGLTLVELMIATGIMIFAISGLFYLFVRIYKLDDASLNLMTAVNHANCYMEKIRHIPFASLNSGSTSYLANDIINIDTYLENETISWTVVALYPTLRRITLTVTWRNLQQGTIDSTYTVSTLRASY